MLLSLSRCRRSIALVLGLALPALLVVAAGAIAPASTAKLADQALSTFQTSVQNDRGIRLGSLGSGMFRAPGDTPEALYTVTDRGPNGQPDGGAAFPSLSSTPRS